MASQHTKLSDWQESRFPVANVRSNYRNNITTTVRRYDTEHLILGTRLHDWSKYNQKVASSAFV